MKRPPRNPRQSFLTPQLIGRIVLVGGVLLLAAFGLFELALASGADEPYARTVAVNVFVLVETFYLFNCRSLRRSMLTSNPWGNPYAYVGAAAMIAVQLLFTYAPFMNAAFHTAPITLGAWLQVLGVAAVAAVLVEIEKTFKVFE
jgi:Ca2+-transporting ATPase